MACLFPISILNSTKFIASQYQQRLLLRVACGKCAECSKTQKNEWYYRALHEYQACVNSGGYMLFDCLTYSERTVPKISDFFAIPKKMGKNSLNHYCFDYKHVTLWKKSVREQLVRDGYDVDENLKFFIAAEYGTKETGTHRPHYHVLAFVYNNFIDPEVLNNVMSEKWQYGRTDGIRYKGKKYFYEEVLVRSSLSSSIRCCKYVAKYVVKDSVYQEKIDKRINRMMFYLFENQFEVDKSKFCYEVPFDKEIDRLRSFNRCYKVRRKIDYDAFNEFVRSPRGKRLRQSIERRVNQFHRQSHGFGASALDTIDEDLLLRSGCVSVVDNDKPIMLLACPSYYKRKLYQEKVTYKGVQFWRYTAKGRLYRQKRDLYRLQTLQTEIQTANKQFNLGLSSDKITELARYEVYQRGRNNGNIATEFFNIETTPNLDFSYISPSDFQHFHYKGVTIKYLGSSQTGYSPDSATFIPIKQYLSRHVVSNPENDAILDKISDLNRSLTGDKKQSRFVFEQQLNYAYSILIP